MRKPKAFMFHLFLAGLFLGVAYLLNRIARDNNGGYMPVKTFVETLMIQGRIMDNRHIVMTGLTQYPFLCDIIEIPGIAILSIGDILAYCSLIFPIRWLLL